MRQGWVLRAQRALLVVVFALPFSHTATAVDIYYTRAIGDPYEYHPPPASAETAAEDVRTPRSEPSRARDAALPGLGTEAPAPAAAESGRGWSRVLIGALIIGGMAALANRGGDGEVNTGVDIGIGGTTPPGSAGASNPPTGGSSSSGGGGSPNSPPNNPGSDSGGSGTPRDSGGGSGSASAPSGGGSSINGGASNSRGGSNDKGNSNRKGKSQSKGQDKGKKNK